MATFYQYFAALVISLLQGFFILAKGYFLSVEFTLYPYLVKNNFVPYRDIIDQHFPSLFFGFVSLPLLSQKSYLPLLILLLGINFLSSLLLFRYLLLTNTQNSFLLTALYVTLMAYFSANTLWVELFINFIIILILNLNVSENKITSVFIGFLLFQVVLMRPTLILTAFMLVVFFHQNRKNILLGLFIGFITTIFYFLRDKNFLDFYQVAVKFNFNVYSVASSVLPLNRQVISIFLLLLWLFINFPRTKSETFLFLATFFSLLSAYPRFGLEHLQPFVLLCVLYVSLKKNKTLTYEIFILFAFLVQVFLGLYKNRYGNYFYRPALLNTATVVSSYPQESLYLFGASDLLYPLTNKYPPHKTYIPSLAWYLSYPDYQKKLYKALRDSDTLVLVDKEFSVDGQKLVDQVPEIYEYIKMNYNLMQTMENIEIYSNRQ